MIAQILISVAKELSDLAKNSLPKLEHGENITREWVQDGVYYRETSFNCKSGFDFKTRSVIQCC